MLCPSCLYDVDKFDAEYPHRDHPGYKCPKCKEPVPENYVKDYRDYPPIVYFLMSLPGHGKSVYLARLFVEFETVGRKWLEFFYTPIQERFLESVRIRQHALERGAIPDSADRMFTKPAVVRLDGVPGLGKCQLILYDYPADKEPDPRDTRFLNGYFGRNKVMVFLLSLNDVQSPAELTDFLTRYSEQVAKMNQSISDQTLIVALTKSDQLLEMEELPEYIRKSILGEFSTSDEEKDVLSELSGIIEAWLETQKTTMNFVRRAKAEFKEVLFTSTVAVVPDNGKVAETSEITPGVWWPLRLAWRTQQPILKEEDRKRLKRQIGQAAKESVTDIWRGILGGVLGLIEGAIWGAILWALVGGFEGWLDKLEAAETLNLAIKQGIWGIIWGALLWGIAGMSDAIKDTGSHIRNGVRIGAISWFLVNGLIAAIIWGLTLTAFTLLKTDASLEFGMLVNNALIGVALGARMGGLLGAGWGLVVRSARDDEIREPSGMAWSLLVSSLVAVVVYLLAELDMLYTHLLWGAVSLMIFTLWAGVRHK